MATDNDRDVALVATPNVLQVLTANPGLAFTPSQVRDLVANTLVVHQGCLTLLRYGQGDEDLDAIRLDGGPVLTEASISNLKKFRERLQDAANHGHRVSFCVNTQTKTMLMLNVQPCRCPCPTGQAD